MKSILEYDHIEARRFFLKEESFFNFDLPNYFVFQNLISKISNILKKKDLLDLYGTEVLIGKKKTRKFSPTNFEGVNYNLLTNKDGKFDWRPFKLIHPVLYVSLVNEMTIEKNWNLIINRFKEYKKNHKINCFSTPIESLKNFSDKEALIEEWYRSIEQKSIELALEFKYVIHTDIVNCYSSIYTHSIPWAIHTKEFAKKEKNNKNLIGNIIDKHIRDMSFGQTNGIPQGSVLMDFIAEIILGYVDLKLSEKIKKSKVKDYYILRFRDDYRIFSNNPEDSNLIVKFLSEILFDVGMKLNSEKTLVSENIIESSLKPDKLYWIKNKRIPTSFLDYLLLILSLSEKFPNSGTLIIELNNFYNKIISLTKVNIEIPILVSILIDITFKNPRTYPISTAILSKLFSLTNSNFMKHHILSLIEKKFDKIPNTGHLQIWLQRLTLLLDKDKIYNEKVCMKVLDSNIPIWNKIRSIYNPIFI